MGFLARFLKFSIKIGIVVAGIAVLISYARLSDLGDMRKELMSRIADSYAGRLHIGGEIDLQMTFPPSISIGDVRLRNAKWASRPDMLVADRMVAEIDFLPLLRGEMAVPRLRMIGVDIIVEQRKDGTTNWDELQDFETAAGPANPAGIPNIIPTIGGASVSIAGGTLTVLNTLASGAGTVLSLGGAIGGGIIPCL